MSRTILILDDDATFRSKILLPKLEQQGYTVIEAGRVREAERLIDEKAVDLFIIDGLLPDKTGIDFIETLRKRGDKAPIIFISAFWKDMKSYRQLTGMGVAHVLSKPVDPGDVCRKIDSLLQGQD